MRPKKLKRYDHDTIQRAVVLRDIGGSSRKGVEAGLFLACLCFFLIAFFPSISAAKSVTLAWDENREPNIAGYRIYYRIGSSGARVASRYNGTGIKKGASPIDMPVYEDENLDPRFVEMTLHGLNENRDYYFVVTAYNTEGLESAPSNEASLVRTAAIVDSPAPSAPAAIVERPAPSASAAIVDSPAPSTSAAASDLGGGGGGCFISSLCAQW